jgi:hypothetical protein
VLGSGDPHVFDLPDADPLVRGPDPAPFSHNCVDRTEIMFAKLKF